MFTRLLSQPLRSTIAAVISVVYISTFITLVREGLYLFFSVPCDDAQTTKKKTQLCLRCRRLRAADEVGCEVLHNHQTCEGGYDEERRTNPKTPFYHIVFFRGDPISTRTPRVRSSTFGPFFTVYKQNQQCLSTPRNQNPEPKTSLRRAIKPKNPKPTPGAAQFRIFLAPRNPEPESIVRESECRGYKGPEGHC